MPFSGPLARRTIAGGVALAVALGGCAKKGPPLGEGEVRIPGGDRPLRLAMVTTADPAAAALKERALRGLKIAKVRLAAEIASEEPSEPGHYHNDLASFVAQDYDDVFAVGADLKADLIDVARNYPKRHFAFIGDSVDLANVTSIVFRTRDGALLAGALAAALTRTPHAIVIRLDRAPTSAALTNGFLVGARIGGVTVPVRTSPPRVGDTLFERDPQTGDLGLVEVDGDRPIVLARVATNPSVAVLEIAEDARSAKLPAGAATFGLGDGAVTFTLTSAGRRRAGATTRARLVALEETIRVGGSLPFAARESVPTR